MTFRRTIRLILPVAVIAACTLSPTPEQQLQETLEAARLALDRGRFSETDRLVDRGVALSDSRLDDWAWKFRLLRAEALVNRLKLNDAAPLLTASVPSGEAFDAVRARQKYLQAKAYVIQGRFPEGLEALTSAERLAPGDGALRLDTEILGGQVRLRMGNAVEAERRLLEVEAAAAKQGDRHRQALAQNNVGMGRLARGRYDEALAWFNRVLSGTDLKEMTVYATALYNAGICYSRLGQFEQALVVQQRALQVHESNGPSLQLVQSLGSLGNTYILQGQNEKALPFLQRALAVARDLGLTEDAGRWARNLASAHAHLHQWDLAERFNDEARRLGVANQAVKPVQYTLNAADIAAGRGEMDKAVVLFEEALSRTEGAPSVRWYSHAGIANLSVASKQYERAARHFEAALDIIEKTRSNLLKTEFKLSFLTQLIEFYQAYVDALIDQGRADKALEIAESSRGRVLAERHGIQAAGKSSVAAMRAVARQSGAVFLSYWLAPKRSHVWVVSAEGVRSVALPPAAELEKLVSDHEVMIQNTLADPLVAMNSPGSRLYELLIAPVSKAIPPGARVVIVPDGALHRLNFETLPVNGARRHYWIEDVEIQVAPSLAMLSVQPASLTANRSLLLIGDPAPREPQYPSLRYASAEMTGIAKQFGPGDVTTYQRDKAVPAAFREAKPDQFGMIHFTAHAMANQESPLDSAVILSGPDHAFKLYARDVAEQPLRADLVTVSACRSAGERTYSGEGLIGFAWAFLRAGTKRVVAGLWDVDDRSTAELMEHMYQQIGAGIPPPRALREAKLSFLRKGGSFAKPYYWGPFEVFTLVL